MKDWILSDAGDKWTVKLGTRDLGEVIWILRIGGGLPGFGLACCCFGNYVFALNFVGKPMSLRTIFLPGALHAIKGPCISFSLLQRLRTAIVSAVWSTKMPLAHVGAVLSLWDGPPGCDPGFLCGLF